MLEYARVKNHAGMMLIGDYRTLRAFHDLIHKLADSSALFQEHTHGEFLLGLAYDVRKAFELQREIIDPPPHYDEVGRRYGVKVLWPVFLVQVRLLREAMGFCPTDEWDQGVAFLLEHAALIGLADDIGGTDVIESWRRLSCNPASIPDRVKSRAGVFLQWTKAARRAGLRQLLDSLDSMFEFWYERDPSVWRRGISPETFHQISQSGEFPEPRW
jgi:hypothetical protein